VAIPARIIRNPLGAAMIAPFNMTAKLGRSATQKVEDNLVMVGQKGEGFLILSNIFP
jgi:hypothetical protein